MESVRDVAACALDGVLIREASAFHRIASADVFLFDHHPALEQAGLEVRGVQLCDGVDEDDVLRLAASAFTGLADDRAAALNAACALRRLIVRRDLRPSYRGPEITLRDRDRSVTIRDVPEAGPPGDRLPGLEVSADERPVGRIAFARAPVPRAAEAIRELRRQGPLTIGLVSDRPAAEAASLAAVLDMDFHVGGLSSEARAVAVRSLRERGLKVAYVGDCRRQPDAAREAHVAISLADGLDLADDPAQVLVLRPGLDWVAGLRERSRSHVGCIRTVHGFILVPNLVCIAGAFFLGFTSLAAVILTNLGDPGRLLRPAAPAGPACTPFAGPRRPFLTGPDWMRQDEFEPNPRPPSYEIADEVRCLPACGQYSEDGMPCHRRRWDE